MSQTVKLKVALTDGEAIRRACIRMDIPAPEVGETRLYQNELIKGVIINLPGWSYPVVILPDGSVKYDNYNGHWGNMDQLDQLAQMYVIEGARINAESVGAVVSESTLENGDVELQLEYV